MSQRDYPQPWRFMWDISWTGSNGGVAASSGGSIVDARSAEIFSTVQQAIEAAMLAQPDGVQSSPPAATMCGRCGDLRDNEPQPMCDHGYGCIRIQPIGRCYGGV